MNRFSSPRFSSVTAVFALLLVAAPAFAIGTLSEKDAKKDAERVITDRNLHSYLSFIASDELAGRDTPSVGLDTAARYIATFLDRWGFEPMGGDGTFLQTIALKATFVDAGKSAATVAGRTLAEGTDFVPTNGSDATNAVAAPVPLVFVGHGFFVKSKGIDAYAGVDVRGKIVVIAPGRRFPPGVTPADLPRAGRGTDWITPDEYARKSGAVGIIRLPTAPDTAAWNKSVAAIAYPRRVALAPVAPVAPSEPAPPALPAITLSPDAANALFAGERITVADALKNARTVPESGAFEFAPGKTATLSIAVHTETMSTQNVVAVWRGSDARLKNEYVALGAHYDHLGVEDDPAAKGDRIYNGADDDGSGTVALLSMAETLAAHPDKRPRRSLLFVWHCGEEKGLWGSAHFTEHPTVPLKSIAAQLNIDMIGRAKKTGDTAPRNANLADENTIYVIGARKIAPALGDLLDRVNKDYTKLSYDVRYDDERDPNQFYRRSDHYNYAKRGIPIAFFFDGVHADYHRVTDEVSTIDFVKYGRVARTIFVSAVAVADTEDALKR